MHVYTDDALISPVFASELAEWAKLDSDDPTIDGALSLATSAVFSFTKQDFTERTWTLTHKDWPTLGTAMRYNISPNDYGYCKRIELPYANLISVESVTVNGDAVTDFRTIKGKPCQIELDTIGYTDTDSDALVVVYKAGYGTSTADVPDAVRKAIMLTATYIIAHNGMCQAGEALTMSGAKSMLAPYAVRAGITI
jgi:hypothetical protein